MAINYLPTCDACGLEIHGEVVTQANYDGVYHRQCKNPKVMGNLLIGYDNVVIDVIDTEEEVRPSENASDWHPPGCGCNWCTPLALPVVNSEY